MITFLLVLNFALLIMAFFLIIILYLRQSRMQDIEKSQTSTIKEMEDLLSTYLIEMKEENEEFLNKIKNKNTSQPSGSKPKEKKKAISSPTHIDLQVREENPTELLPNYLEDNSIESITKQALSLQKQGLTIEKIAKQLNKGKTEIELLLKFRQN